MELVEAFKYLGAGLAVIGGIGAGLGMGNIFAAFISAVGRNPGAKKRGIYYDNAWICSC